MDNPAEAQSSVELLDLGRQGNSEALGRLLERYRPRLRNLARRLLGFTRRDGIGSEDLVQDAIERTLKQMARPEFDGSGGLNNYITSAVYNLAKNVRRNAGRRPLSVDLPPELAALQPSPLDAVIVLESYDRYRAALSQLTVDEQELIIGYYELGLSHAELARDTGRPSPDAARMALRRALDRLHQVLSGGRRI